MDYKQIEELLQRYWLCETSLEEEAQLRTFFTTEEVPPHLVRYKELFALQQQLQEAKLSDDFDARVLAEMQKGATVVKARRVSLRTHLMPLFKAAAVVAVTISLGLMVQQGFLTNEEEAATGAAIGEQISAPSVALSKEKENRHEIQRPDSLKQSPNPSSTKEK